MEHLPLDRKEGELERARAGLLTQQAAEISNTSTPTGGGVTGR